MRVFYAILLTALVLFNWIEGCLLCFEYTRTWEATYQMNQAEATLAHKLEAQLLPESAVKIVDKSFTGRTGMAYPGDFVFAEAHSGDTTYFVVQTESSPEANVQITLKDRHPSGQAQDLPGGHSFQDFFSPYLYSHTAFSLCGPFQSALSAFAALSTALPESVLVCPQPPPELV